MKNIFSYNTYIEKNAYLSWRMKHFENIENMIAIAEGFRDSSLFLIEGVLQNNNDKKADSLIFPILFNANHSIEVYLKAINWTQNKLLSNKESFALTHDLKSLFNNIKKLEKEIKSPIDKKAFQDRFDNLERYINELYRKIEKKNKNNKMTYDITFSRYPLGSDKQPQFYTNTFENEVVDVENLLLRFEDIFKQLSNLYSHYLKLLESKQAGQYSS